MVVSHPSKLDMGTNIGSSYLNTTPLYGNKHEQTRTVAQRNSQQHPSSWASAAPVASSRPNIKHLYASTCTAMSQTIKANNVKLWPYISRRVGSIALISSLVLASTSNGTASGFEFRMTVPEQSIEEAEGLIKGHVRALLDVKSLLEEEDWREAQRELRQNSGYLRQDIYTIIQSKEGSVRPLLRKLYRDLFNNVTKLDYAARNKDVDQVWKYYNNVTTVLNDILSRF